MPVSSQSLKKTIIRDPIHGFIDTSYYDFISKIIQTPHFQRLRRLSQLGVSVFVYPSATHNRFNHSLGAMELFVRLFDHLYKNQQHTNIYHKLRKTGIAAVLLHDIGHGPFSHASESVFGFQHDALSIKIIRTAEMREILEKARIDPEDVVSVISRTARGKMKLLSQLINSQLDVDRLDYLARDVYFTGVGFGRVDLERIIRTMTISKSNGFLKGYAVIEEKGKHSIESYLLTRTLMYDDVYYHKTTRCVERLIDRIFVRMSDLSKNDRLKAQPELDLIKKSGTIFKKDTLTPYNLLYLDDHCVYALLLRWSKDSNDKIVTDLCRRVIERRLLKSIDYTSDEMEIFLEKMKKVQGLVTDKLKLDPNYYCIMDEPLDRPYEPVGAPTDDEEVEESLKKNIYIESRNGDQLEISETSDVINALTKKKRLVRLYFPENIRHDVHKIFKKK